MCPEPAAEKGIYDYRILAEHRHFKGFAHLINRNINHLQTFKVHGAVGGKLAFGVYEPHCYATTRSMEHACDSKAIATIIAGSRKYGKATARIAFKDSSRKRACSPFHKVYGADGLMLDCVGIELPYSRCAEEFHNCARYSRPSL